MKIVILIVATAIVLPGQALAVPQGFFDFNGFPFGAAFQGQASALASATVPNPFADVDLSDGQLNNNFNGLELFAELFRSGAETLTRSASNIFVQRIKNIASYGRVLLSYISALKDEIDYSGVKSEFGSLERNLRSISNEADKLTELLSTLHKNRNTQINEAEGNQTKSIADWSSILLERLDTRTDSNEWARNEVESVINEFVQRQFDLQDSCREEALAEIDDLEKSAQRPLEQIEKIERDFVNKLQTCASSTNNRAQQSRCKRDINNISKKLTNAARDIRQAQNSARQLNNPREQYKNRDCVKDTLLDYNLEKFGIELKVEAFISQASAHPNQTKNDGSATTQQQGGNTQGGTTAAGTDDNQTTDESQTTVE